MHVTEEKVIRRYGAIVGTDDIVHRVERKDP